MTTILRPREITKPVLDAADLPEQVAVALAELASAAKERLPAFSVGVGLATRSRHDTNADGQHLAARLHLPWTIVKDLIVGGIGFPINQLVLFLLHDAGIAPSCRTTTRTSTSSSSSRPTHASDRLDHRCGVRHRLPVQPARALDVPPPQPR